MSFSLMGQLSIEERIEGQRLYSIRSANINDRLLHKGSKTKQTGPNKSKEKEKKKKKKQKEGKNQI